MITVRIQTEDFDSGAELALIEDSVGAVSSFTGIVRGEGGLISLTLEHYPAMTKQVLTALAEDAATRWSLAHVTLIHRVGPLYPSNRIVFVATASPHRAAALESCAFLIDRLKTDAPFWKKESFADGRETWVDAREDDGHAASRWR